MPRVAVTMIESICGSVATTDGRHMVLEMRDPDGTDIALGVPHAQIVSLIDHCAVANAQCERVLRSDLDLSTTVSWWNSALDQKSKELRLVLTFGSGGTMSFALSERMAKALLATLRAHYESGTEPPPLAQTNGACLSDDLVEPGFR